MSGEWADVAASNARLLAAAERELEALRAGLRALEWDDETDTKQCAWCLGSRRMGHFDGCNLAALLATIGRGEP